MRVDCHNHRQRRETVSYSLLIHNIIFNNQFFYWATFYNPVNPVIAVTYPSRVTMEENFIRATQGLTLAPPLSSRLLPASVLVRAFYTH